MARLGSLVLLVTILALVDLGSAQDGNKLKKKTAPSTPVTAESLSSPLVPPDILAKLKLTEEQRSTANQLIADFTAKNKALVAKVPATATTPAAKGKLKGKGVAPPPELQAVLSLRQEYEKKFEELLTEPQKRSYDELLARRAEQLLKGK